MSYLQRIAECNQYDLSNYLPFSINQEQLGWTGKGFANELTAWPEVFSINDHSITINDSLKIEAEISLATAPIFEHLHKKGTIDTWVNEKYPVVQNFGETPRMHMERAATTYLGVKSFGIHLNGLVRKADGIYVWVGKRTLSKPFWPGKLDQMVAGGQPAGMGLLENVIKEASEEANVPEKVASKAQYVTALNYCSEVSRGINPDTLFVYDLWLPESFVPENTDGEVESFQLMCLEELADLIENTQEFKHNCNLVNIDLLLRLGFINPEHSDYTKIKEQLYVDGMKF